MEEENPPPLTGMEVLAEMPETEAAPASVRQPLPEEHATRTHVDVTGDRQPEHTLTEFMLSVWDEMRSLRQQLDDSHSEQARLQAELEAAEKALDYTKCEIANLWHVMTTRNLKDATRRISPREEARLVHRLTEERSRIQSKIEDVRSLARRRRWPWSLVG